MTASCSAAVRVKSATRLTLRAPLPHARACRSCWGRALQSVSQAQAHDARARARVLCCVVLCCVLPKQPVTLHALEGHRHSDNPFKRAPLNHRTAGRVSSDEDSSGGARFAADWLAQAVRNSAAASCLAAAEHGQGARPAAAGGGGGQAEAEADAAARSRELTRGLLECGRPAVHRLHDADVQAGLRAFGLDGRALPGTLGQLRGLRWGLPALVGMDCAHPQPTPSREIVSKWAVLPCACAQIHM